MNSILIIPFQIIICLLTLGNSFEFETQDKSDYEKTLNIAAELYLSKKDIPIKVLLGLVPQDYSEFELYYRTTYPDQKLSGTDFFYVTTRLIFEQVTSEKNDEFYLPSLKLISFADGEFGEEFIEYLELIIEMDNLKFCNAINGKKYAKTNPIKYYSELHKCK